jgi:membrane protein
MNGFYKKNITFKSMQIKKIAKNLWILFSRTFSEFMNDNAMKLSAALSYYTILSLPPLLIIIISLSGIFFGQEAVRGEIFWQINGLVGNDAAAQIQDMIKHVAISTGTSRFATILGIITLIIGASGVFSEIQDSINYIWGLKPKPKRGFMKFVKNRLMSFSMIGSVGFLLVVGLIVNTLMEILNQRLVAYFPHVTVYLFYVLNIAAIFLIITLLFSVVFKTLPDGKVSLKDALIGASFTALLFMMGKFAIGFYLGTSKISSVYGAAGSIVLILVWVYYSAIILYFGAEFTKVYALNFGKKIIANSYAVFIEKECKEIEPRVVDVEN